MGIDKLPPYYVTGLVEGEGCFSLSLNKNKELKFGWETRPLFSVGMDGKNRKLLELMCNTMGLPIDNIRLYKSNSRNYEMAYVTTQKIDDLFSKVIPFFEKYPLVGPKKLQFDVWKQGVILKKNKQNTTVSGLNSYLKLREEIHRSTKSKRKWKQDLTEIKYEI